MRIAMISTPFIRLPPRGYGGTELFCYELAEELTARGYSVLAGGFKFTYSAGGHGSGGSGTSVSVSLSALPL